MNQLSLKIDKNSSGAGSVLLLYIDKRLFRVPVDSGGAVFLDELHKSVLSPGDYLIFTCLCGVADCGGWQKVAVSHHREVLSWAFEYADRKYKFQFDRYDYRMKIEKIKRQISAENIKLIPEWIVDPE